LLARQPQLLRQPSLAKKNLPQRSQGVKSQCRKAFDKVVRESAHSPFLFVAEPAFTQCHDRLEKTELPVN
jgi:hypothetical protein